MKVKELRIGNYVQQNNNIYKIKDIFDNRMVTLKKPGSENRRYICDEDDNLSQIKPIELDEKWLLAFGFEYDEKTDLYHSGEGCRISVDLILFRVFMADTSNTALPIQIKYLHQLQNLYFALSGDELEFEYRHDSQVDDPTIYFDTSSDKSTGFCGKAEDHYQSSLKSDY